MKKYFSLFWRWLELWVKKHTLKTNTKILSLKNIYIIPSAFGFCALFIILSIAIGAINYQLNTAFFLVFISISLALVGIWETYRNLQGVTIHCLPIDDTQEGRPAIIHLLIKGEKLKHYSIDFCVAEGEPVKLERLINDNVQISLAVPTLNRGHFVLPIVKISTYFPLGIFKAWSYAYFDRDFFVYPEPVSPGFWPETPTDSFNDQDVFQQKGDDDLFELNSVSNPWAQPGRIAWKISAQGQGWYLKKMTTPKGENWVFKLEDLANGNLEQRLQALSYWIQSAENQGFSYGLELNGATTPIDNGKEHLKTCLRQLAVY